MDVGLDRHFRVRHGQDQFVRIASHLNGIESFWSFAKARFHQFKGLPKHAFLPHLKKVEFRFNYRCKDFNKLLYQHPL